MSIRCVRGDQGSACPEGLGSASWRQKGPRRGSARWVWSDPVSQNGTPASVGSLPGTGDGAQNRAWRAGIMSFPLWTMDGRGIRRGWAECLPLASGRFCPFLGRKPGHSRCLGSSATPRILLCRRFLKLQPGCFVPRPTVGPPCKSGVRSMLSSCQCRGTGCSTTQSWSRPSSWKQPSRCNSQSR